MYTITFNEDYLKSMRDAAQSGTHFQLYSALLIPDCGLYTNNEKYTSNFDLLDLVCPYAVGDILAIKEWWARGNNKYLYKIDSTSSSENYDNLKWRPPTSMPNAAARLHFRIVSIVTWDLTVDIYNHYLVKGSNPNSYAAACKVTGYYDDRRRMLYRIWKPHNDEVLSKTYQPQVLEDSSRKPIIQDNHHVWLISGCLCNEEGEFIGPGDSNS